MGEFLAVCGRFLASDPVGNTVLLTEAHFWRRLSSDAPGARLGWCVEPVLDRVLLEVAKARPPAS